MTNIVFNFVHATLEFRISSFERNINLYRYTRTDNIRHIHLVMECNILIYFEKQLKKGIKIFPALQYRTDCISYLVMEYNTSIN